MTISGTGRRIEQLTRQGKTPALGTIIMDIIDRGTKQRIADLTNEFSKGLGNVCIDIDPGIARSQYARIFLGEIFSVRFAPQPNHSRDEERRSYMVYFGEKPYNIITNSDPSTVEAALKKEIEILNRMGFNLEYAGQYVPPDA